MWADSLDFRDHGTFCGINGIIVLLSAGVSELTDSDVIVITRNGNRLAFPTIKQNQ